MIFRTAPRVRGEVSFRPLAEVTANLQSDRADGEDCTLVARIVPFTHLTQDGMTVTIGRRELLAALGGAGWVTARGARSRLGTQPTLLRMLQKFRRG